MNFEKALSEPLRRIVDHHNAFNRRIKLLYGSLNKVMEDGLEDNNTIKLPYGEEPWGEPKTWKSATDGHAAAQLLAELGIVRAASAFEDYLEGTIAEIDRAQIGASKGTTTDAIERVLLRLSVGETDRPSIEIVRFFDCARNCIVHQMGRANNELVKLNASPELQSALAVHSPRKKAKWKPALPAIALGNAVTWKPRHAILASDAYYKVAVSIDRNLVTLLGDARFVAMAAHWAVAAPIPTVSVRRSLIATIRAALNDRYRVNIRSHEIAPLLKSINKWDELRAKFQKMHPNHIIS